MPILDPDPIPVEPQTANIGLCDDQETAEAVRAQYDAEHGMPIHCRCADGTEPPPGVPRTILHAMELEPIGDGRVAHPLPSAALPAAVAAKCQPRTRAQVDALKAQHAEPEPLSEVGEPHLIKVSG
jgi:hypothetical protein